MDVTVSTTGRSVQGVVNTFSAIEQVELLGTNSDRLLGGIAQALWSIDAFGKVVVGAVTYAGFEVIEAGSGLDTLSGPALETTWNIAGSNSGQVNASGLNYTFSGIENLTGGVAEDIIVFQPSGVLSGNVNGGTGAGNTISYAAWTLGVGVNLTNPIANGNATAVLGTLKNISIVMGGNGNDILIGNSSTPTVLVGNAGNDTLTGLAGRDILIGGVGADTLSGAGGEDILIGGSTSHDTSHTALLKILSEWRDTTRVFAQRVNNLRGIGVAPRANGDYFLSTDTVFADLETDSLTGGNGRDWFWGDLSEILDFKSSGLQSDLRN